MMLDFEWPTILASRSTGGGLRWLGRLGGFTCCCCCSAQKWRRQSSLGTGGDFEAASGLANGQEQASEREGESLDGKHWASQFERQRLWAGQRGESGGRAA